MDTNGYIQATGSSNYFSLLASPLNVLVTRGYLGIRTYSVQVIHLNMVQLTVLLYSFNLL